jgi:hypothetical protein
LVIAVRNLLEYTGATSWNIPMTNRMEKMRLENVSRDKVKTTGPQPIIVAMTFSQREPPPPPTVLYNPGL